MFILPLRSTGLHQHSFRDTGDVGIEPTSIALKAAILTTELISYACRNPALDLALARPLYKGVGRTRARDGGAKEIWEK